MSDTPRNEAGVARRPHRTYSLEFKRQVVQEALEPGTSVAAVARKHGLNDNLLFAWRLLYQQGKLGVPAPQQPLTELLPVSVTDISPPRAVSQPVAQEMAVQEAPSARCDVEIEVGKRCVRIRGLSMERAERFLRECLQ